MSWLLITIFFSYFFLLENSYGVEGRKGFGPGDQDWGSVDVREGAHMFWWLYYANPPHKLQHSDPYKKPLIIWIQGGPGSSGTAYGNFEEFGPLDVDLKRRNYTWVKDFNVLFIDTPVGTGFSYVDDNSRLAKSNNAMVIDLYNCIVSFMKTHPKFKSVPTYILTESYGGKVAAHLAFVIAKTQNWPTGTKMNLKGLGLGDSFTSPIDIVSTYAPYLLQTGMINSDCYKRIDNLAVQIKEYMNRGNWNGAAQAFIRVFWGEIVRCTNGIDYFNILERKVTKYKDYSLAYTTDTRPKLTHSDFDQKLYKLMDGEVRQALGISRPFNMRSQDIKYNLLGDYMKPVDHIVEQVLNETNIKVFVYNGQLDVVVPIASTVAWVERLNWPGAKNWLAAKRKPITIDNTLEGFVQGDGKFKMFWVSRSGHMVPKDNPYAMDVILKMLTSG